MTGDPFANPLLFIVPVLGILAMTLVLIRLLPFVLRVVAWLLGLFRGAALVMAARQLSRSPSLYAALYDKSIKRLSIKGPRSLTRTTTVLPLAR